MIKRILLSLFFLGSVFVINTNAQSTDGFFKVNNNDIYNNRDVTINGASGGFDNINMNPQSTDEEAPIGSGLLIMMAAGAGYAVARRKRASRKGMTMLLALGLILGMTQCKKNTVTPVTPAGNSVHITLDANFGGEKTGFDPATGQFVWSSGRTEYINVGGAKSGYLGQLQSTEMDPEGIVFSGDITPAADEGTLYFFYLGNGDHKEATTVDFSNQYGDHDRMTNWHIAIGQSEYEPGQTTFKTTLNMAMAYAYFNISQFTDASNTLESVYIHGDDVYSTATINYNNGTITGASKGYIRLGNEIGNTSKYVALIPSVTTETVINFDSNSKTGSLTFYRGIKPASFYSDGGEALAVAAEAGSGIPGTFSVSASKKVFFSKGNLQYQASTGTWRFAENQYDFVGNSSVGNVYETIGGIANTKCDNTQIADNYEGWIDLFGWGTSGYNHGATNYQPYKIDKNVAYYYAYGNKDYDLDSEDGKADWGIQNSSSIINSYEYHTWRTLTSAEWQYLFNTSSGRCTEGVYFCKCRIQTETSTYVNGIIVLPDNWDNTYYAFPSDWYNKPAIGYDKVTVSIENWINQIQNNGGVFIPAAGKRSGTSYSDSGYMDYWSSTHYNDNYIYTLRATGYGGNMGDNTHTNYRYDGCAVRLVYDVE